MEQMIPIETTYENIMCTNCGKNALVKVTPKKTEPNKIENTIFIYCPFCLREVTVNG